MHRTEDGFDARSPNIPNGGDDHWRAETKFFSGCHGCGEALFNIGRLNVRPGTHRPRDGVEACRLGNLGPLLHASPLHVTRDEREGRRARCRTGCRKWPESFLVRATPATASAASWLRLGYADGARNH